MQLTLRVVRAPEVLLPEPRRVAETELNIGRGPENDWVLPDPNRHLSKRHCTLTMRGGRWSVTDRSTNGTFVNRDIQPVGDGQTRNLRDGDRLRLGLYEIEVRITEEETLHGRHTAWITQAGIDTPNNDPFGNDPFASDPFGANPAGANPAGDRPAGDRPVVSNEGARGPGRYVPSGPPQGPDATLPQETPLNPPTNPVIRRSLPDEPVEAMTMSPPDLPPPTPGMLTNWDPERSRSLETVNFPTQRPVAEARPAASEPELLGAFMRGVGMPDAVPADPAAVMEALGATFRALVIGLREVMIVRAKIKGEFRIEQTLMRAQGNNPLKFSADDQDALAALLGIGRRIDMKPADAVAAALKDLHSHEAATIGGMRAGMRAVLSRLDPERLAATVETGGPPGLSPQGKVRAWDLFVRQHADIAAAAPDDFEGIFGRAFARGYEQSLKDLE